MDPEGVEMSRHGTETMTVRKVMKWSIRQTAQDSEIGGTEIELAYVDRIVSGTGEARLSRILNGWMNRSRKKSGRLIRKRISSDGRSV